MVIEAVGADLFALLAPAPSTELITLAQLPPIKLFQLGHKVVDLCVEVSGVSAWPAAPLVGTGAVPVGGGCDGLLQVVFLRQYLHGQRQ